MGLPDITFPFSGSVTGNTARGTSYTENYVGFFQVEMEGTLSGDTMTGVYSIYAYLYATGESLSDTGFFSLSRPPTEYSLSVTKSGAGSGTVTSTPSGISCGTTCTASFKPDTVVTPTATPDTNSVFAGWTGCDAVSGNLCTVSTSTAKSVTARFASQSMAAAGSLLYGDFNSDGIWLWNGTDWSKITGSNPQNMAAAGSLLYGDFGSDGIWLWNGTDWSKITGSNPSAMTVSGSVLYGDFDTDGIWQWNGAEWSKITGSNPHNLTASDSALYGDFGSDGIWQWDGTAWSMITTSNPEAVAAAGSFLYGDFTPDGIWQWDGTAWSKITASNPQ